MEIMTQKIEKFADLTKAEIRKISLRGADLRYAKLEGAKFIPATLLGTDLRGAEIPEEELKKIKAYYESYEPKDGLKPIFDGMDKKL